MSPQYFSIVSIWFGFSFIFLLLCVTTNCLMLYNLWWKRLSSSNNVVHFAIAFTLFSLISICSMCFSSCDEWLIKLWNGFFGGKEKKSLRLAYMEIDLVYFAGKVEIRKTKHQTTDRPNASDPDSFCSEPTKSRIGPRPDYTQDLHWIGKDPKKENRKNCSWDRLTFGSPR